MTLDNSILYKRVQKLICVYAWGGSPQNVWGATEKVG